MKNRKSQFPAMIGIMTGLVIILLLVFATMFSVSYTNQSHDLPDLNESVEDLKSDFNYSEKKKKCSSYNGTVVNYSYGPNNLQTFVGCRM